MKRKRISYRSVFCFPMSWNSINLFLNVKDTESILLSVRDGNCLFRAVADQVYCDLNLHANVRKLCADYMEEEEEKYFSEFHIEEIFSMDYPAYIDNLRKD